MTRGTIRWSVIAILVAPVIKTRREFPYTLSLAHFSPILFGCFCSAGCSRGYCGGFGNKGCSLVIIIFVVIEESRGFGNEFSGGNFGWFSATVEIVHFCKSVRLSESVGYLRYWQSISRLRNANVGTCPECFLRATAYCFSAIGTISPRIGSVIRPLKIHQRCRFY